MSVLKQKMTFMSCAFVRNIFVTDDVSEKE